jgi:hypothetical protein
LVPDAPSDLSRTSTDVDAGDVADAHGHIDTDCPSSGRRKVAGSNLVAPTFPGKHRRIRVLRCSRLGQVGKVAGGEERDERSSPDQAVDWHRPVSHSGTLPAARLSRNTTSPYIAFCPTPRRGRGAHTSHSVGVRCVRRVGGRRRPGLIRRRSRYQTGTDSKQCCFARKAAVLVVEATMDRGVRILPVAQNAKNPRSCEGSSSGVCGVRTSGASEIPRGPLLRRAPAPPRRRSGRPCRPR